MSNEHFQKGCLYVCEAVLQFHATSCPEKQLSDISRKFIAKNKPFIYIGDYEIKKRELGIKVFDGESILYSFNYKTALIPFNKPFNPK